MPIGGIISKVGDAVGGVLDWGGSEEQREQGRKAQQEAQQGLGTLSDQAAQFGRGSQYRFTSLGGAYDTQRSRLEDIMAGRDSLSGEQLRQGLQQQLAANRAQAASARPGGGAMAARNAMMMSGQQMSGMSGQAALAGIQERRAAQEAYNQLLNQQRQQELQAALEARGQAIGGYGGLGGLGAAQQQAGQGWLKSLAGGAGNLIGNYIGSSGGE